MPKRATDSHQMSDASSMKNPEKKIKAKSNNNNGRKNRKYNFPDGSTLDVHGNLIVPVNLRSRSHSRASHMSASSFGSHPDSGNNDNFQLTSNRHFRLPLAANRPKENENRPKSNAAMKPVYVETSYAVLNNILKTVMFNAAPQLKIQSSRSVKVICSSQDDKTKLQEKLKSQMINYVTFTEPDKKPSSYVLLGHDHVSCDDLLKKLINECNIPAIKVTFISKKEDYPVYLVHFKHQEMNLNILQAKHKAIGNLIVKWQRFDRSRKQLTQCFNCQQYGHASSNCGRSYRCVKCLETHLPKECSRKSSNDEGSPKCVNCGGEHAANSRICQAYKDYAEKVKKNRINRQKVSNFIEHHQNQHQHVSYSSATARGASHRNAASFAFKESDFPAFSPSNNVKLTRNVNASIESSTLFSDAARLNAIPGIKQTFARYGEFITELEKARDETSRMFIIIKYLNPDLLKFVPSSNGCN